MLRFTFAVSMLVACAAKDYAAPDADPRRCNLDAGEPQASVVLDLPARPILPLTADLVVRGRIKTKRGVTVLRVLVDGIVASHDGPDFSSFDASVPLATLQSEGAAAGTPSVSSVSIAVGTDCDRPDDTPTVLSLDVPLRSVTTLNLKAATPPWGYLPNSVAIVGTLTLTANREAAGLPVVISASQGTISSPTVLPGDGTTEIVSTVFLTPDPMKQGTAIVTAQAGNLETSDRIAIAAPPTMTPATASIAHGAAQELEVYLDSEVSDVASIISGCSAGVTPGILVHVAGKDISGKGLTPLTAMDAQQHPIFRVDMSGATASTSISVTCMDVWGQTVTGTYSAI